MVALIRNGTIDYSSFARDIETILFHDNVVIVMGSETITPVNKAPFAGQTVRRRFTHFWMRRNGAWRLTARHANVVCPSRDARVIRPEDVGALHPPTAAALGRCTT